MHLSLDNLLPLFLFDLLLFRFFDLDILTYSSIILLFNSSAMCPPLIFCIFCTTLFCKNCRRVISSRRFFLLAALPVLSSTIVLTWPGRARRRSRPRERGDLSLKLEKGEESQTRGGGRGKKSQQRVFALSFNVSPSPTVSRPRLSLLPCG